MTALVLGPMLRHADTESAVVWVETSQACDVEVVAGDRRWAAGTFRVHGHHYAVVDCTDLAPGSREPYVVRLDGEQVWPDPDSALPPPVLATLDPERPVRLAFGSCRTSVTHDLEGNLVHGVDALRSLALAWSGEVAPGDGLPDRPSWPDLMLFLGDQVYADETTKEIREFIASRRDPDQPPGTELKDYQEYAELYRLAWTDEHVRWLLATLPSAMIFDDHDIRDDWNTSAAWRAKMARKPWWQERLVAGLASYWVYQHLGNLSAGERAEDEVWQRIAGHDGEGEPDVSEALDDFVARADEEPEIYRWSYVRELPGARLVVVDSRAARKVEEGSRSMLDEDEMAWLDQQMRGDTDHLLVATSLPYLLPEGLHNLEAFDETLAGGAWPRGARAGERIRQAIDLEHWGAFQRSFHRVAEMLVAVSTGERGAPPVTVTFLSGDVHHSYVSEVVDLPGESRVLQVVCSPIRNPLPQVVRFAVAATAYGLAAPMGLLVRLSRRVPDLPFHWRLREGPWFANSLALLEVVPGGYNLTWVTADVTDGDQERPTVRRLAHTGIREGERPPRRAWPVRLWERWQS